MSDPIIESVIEKLRSRSVRGLDKYGVGLDREDLSVVEWLTHLQEELLDAAGYLEKLIQVMGGRKKPDLDKMNEGIAAMLRKAQKGKASDWTPQDPPVIYGPPPPTIPKTTFDPDTFLCEGKEYKK